MNVNEMSSEQLEQLLEKKKKEERKAFASAKAKYEASRNKSVDYVMNNAIELQGIMTQFKREVSDMMDEQALLLAEYGKIRGNSKGGFTVSNADDTFRITRRRDTEPAWDERGQKAVEMLREFLGDTIKKRDVKLFEILMSFLQRNEKGELEYARVMNLYHHEDKFDDPRWKEGLRLLKESYSIHLRGFGYEFKKKNKEGKWINVSLNFSGLEV